MPSQDLEQRVTRLEQRIDAHDVRISALEQGQAETRKMLEALLLKVDRLLMHVLHR